MVYYREMHQTRIGQVPLGDYHLSPIVDGFKAGASPKRVAALLSDLDWNRQQYGDIPRQSMQELYERERQTSVKIVDEIAEKESRERLFFTFNHPSLQLIAEYSHRILQALGFKPQFRVSSGMMPEPLGVIVVPPNPIAKFSMPGPRTYRVLPVGPHTHGRLSLLTDLQIVELYFEAYARAADGQNTS